MLSVSFFIYASDFFISMICSATWKQRRKMESFLYYPGSFFYFNFLLFFSIQSLVALASRGTTFSLPALNP